jgi:hypothetical protein
MAEARAAAGLSLSISHDGISVSYDQELLRDIWHAFSRSYKKRFARFKVSLFVINFIDLHVLERLPGKIVQIGFKRLNEV